MKLSVTLAKDLKAKHDETQLGFGDVFTDHMFNMDFNPEHGWHNARIEPHAPFVLDPTAMVFHYGQAVFEGLKAYRTPSGGIQLFRPEENFRRLNHSNEILCIPRIDEAFVLDALKELISIEKEWVPSEKATSLYIRPAIIATDNCLGVRASNTYRFFILLCAVGPYYSRGFKPVKLMVEKERVRAIPGGIGEAKTPGNYAASLLAGKRAREAGCSQVLWLDGKEHRYVEEAGSMNIFFVIDGEVVTPALQGSILAGVTRDSIIQLGRMWGLKVSERPITIDEVIEESKTGKLEEMFGSGTAAVVSPVGEIKYGNQDFTVGDGQVGPVAKRFYETLTDIQYGRAEDPFGWSVPVDVTQLLT